MAPMLLALVSRAGGMRACERQPGCRGLWLALRALLKLSAGVPEFLFGPELAWLGWTIACFAVAYANPSAAGSSWE